VADAAAARPWLVRTAHNLCLDRIRFTRSGRAGALSNTELLASIAADGETSPDRRAALRETTEAIAGALALLAPRDRGVLLMREVHGLRYDEMAEVLGLPLGTLKAVVHRARERFREKLLAAGVRHA
jgi:RNA polymerase sigma-70 factor (ECF subfamily)